MARAKAGRTRQRRVPCNKCGRRKPAAEFWQSTLNKRGDGVCKECWRARRAAYYLANRERFAAQRTRWARANPDRVAVDQRRWRARHPAAAAAYSAVAYAIRTGRLRRRPCVICGHARAEAHHPDIRKKLSVVWLCSGCHGMVHIWERWLHKSPAAARRRKGEAKVVIWSRERTVIVDMICLRFPNRPIALKIARESLERGCIASARAWEQFARQRHIWPVVEVDGSFVEPQIALSPYYRPPASSRGVQHLREGKPTGG